MATIMNWRNKDGSQGRCDARCHNAREPECDCRCGGLFHGAARTGSLDRRVLETDQQTLIDLSNTETTPIRGAKPRRTSGFHVPPRRKTPQPAVTWQKTSSTHWTTSCLFDPANNAKGDITRRPDGVHTLVVSGPNTPQISDHPDLARAMRAYETTRNAL